MTSGNCCRVISKYRLNTRNQSIPELSDLSDRILRDFNDYSLLDKIIDYGKVYEVLVVERRKSLEVMKSMT